MRHHAYRVSVVALFALVLGLGPRLPGAAGAPPARGEQTSITARVGEPVNINTADVKELMRLEGIGRKLAERIVQHREAHGPFKKAEELSSVEGVGSGVLERNRARIVVK